MEIKNKKRIVKFREVSSRRSCNAFVFQDMITDERIEITGKGLKKLLEDIGVIGLVVDEGKNPPSNAKEPRPVYYTIVSTAFGDSNGQREIIPARPTRRNVRNRDFD